jgi:hypothetical protein
LRQFHPLYSVIESDNSLVAFSVPLPYRFRTTWKQGVGCNKKSLLGGGAFSYTGSWEVTLLGEGLIQQKDSNEENTDEKVH